MPTIPAIELKKAAIDKLNQQAWDKRVFDSPGAFKLSQRSLQLAKKINYKKGMAQAMRSMGLCYARVGKNDEALPVLKRALALFEELNDLAEQALVFEYMSVVKRNRGELGAAMELVFKAISLSQQTHKKENEAIQHYQLGVTYKYLGNFDKALESLIRSISLHKENRNRFYQSYPIHVIGTIYFETGDLRKALEYFKEGLALRQEFRDKLGEAGSLDAIGYTFFKLGRYSQALQYFKKGLAISKRTGDKRSQANALQHLAEIHAHAGNIKPAIASSDASRKIRRVTGDRMGEAQILLFLAGLPQQQPAQTIEWIREAQHIGKAIKSKDIQSKAHHSLYHYYKGLGKFKEANRELERHYKLEKELQKISVKQKVDNLEIARKAEETKKEAEAIKQQNEELTRLNRELAIESSLERVRAAAMGMHRPDDILDICKAIYKELPALGFKGVRNALINFWDDVNQSLLDYDYSDFSGGHVAKLAYSSHPVFEQFQKKIRSAKDAFAQLVVTKEQLASWRKRRRDSGEYEDPRLNRIDALYYYFYSIGVGAVGISSFNPLTPENLEVLKRFRNVFDLAYRRYLDIEKAEAQAKEAQIEASLERVRASAMSMHQSDQLINVCEAMYKELVSLGFGNIRNAQISIRNITDGMYFVSEYSDRVKIAVKEAPIDKSPLLKSIYGEMERSRDAFYQREISGKEFRDWRKWRINADANQDKRIFKASSMWFYLYSLGTGYIGISTFDSITTEQTQTLKRFRNVFELAYRRYMDVAKAEAQVREAQIEVAVERVRAKALAMHRSEDLHGVVVALKNELMGLQIPDIIAATIYLQQHDGSIRLLDLTAARVDDEDKYVLELDKQFRLEKADPKLWVRRMWEREEHYFVEEADKNDFKRVVKWLQNMDPAGAKMAERIIKEKSITKAWLPTVKLEKGILNIDLLQPPAKEVETILTKMGAGFDLAYKRFLDLQKAESQAKEAQIELALERVRARTMAMQYSEELADTATVLFEQFRALGEPADRIAIGIVNEAEKVFEFWATLHGGSTMQMTFKLPFSEPLIMKKMYAAWKKKERSITIDLYGEKLETYFRFLKDAGVPVQRKVFGKRRVENVATFSKGVLMMIHDEPASAESISILERFAAVFDQTYTRFLDLQKAEAQAREAQIEASLERIRSRTMAMQRSSELPEAANQLFLEVQKLGIPSWSCGYNIFLPDKKSCTCIMSSEGLLQIPFALPLTGHKSFEPWYKAMKNEESFFVQQLDGKELVEHYRYMKTLPELEPVFRQFEEAGVSLPVFQINHLARFEQGFLLFITYETVPEAHSIFRRFAKVFEQTYTRFLDLQKAEVQAREAQIELGLERVRARTMAMQKSDELSQISFELFKQIQSLGIATWHCAFNIYDGDQNSSTEWGTNAGGTYPMYKTPRTGIFLKYYEIGQTRETLHIETIGKDKCADHYAFLCTLPGVGDELIKLRDSGVLFPTSQIDHVAYFKYGYLLFITYEPVPEAHDIFKRFAKVFEQTYTRFLDLQKAEAQAREAQIEAALERVRSRSMAMHKSDELKEVIKVVLDQFAHLNINVGHAGFYIDYRANDDMHIWLADPNLEPFYVVIPYFDTPTWNSFLEAKANNITFHSDLLDFKEKNKFYRSLFKLFPVPEEAKKFYLECKGLAVSTVLLDTVGLYIENFSAIPYSDEENAVLLRFGKVFQQTYTRFLDLQKAEAQAKEAQIEASLERVRSASMAMHSSDELQNVIKVLTDQLTVLGFEFHTANFITNASMPDWDLWLSSPGSNIPPKLFVPYFDHRLFNERNEAVTSGKEMLTVVLSPEEKSSFLNYFFEHSIAKDTDQERIKWVLDQPAMAMTTVVTRSFSLSVVNYYGRSYTASENEVIKRLANVFEQSYTRFLDLKKAEAQAREATIEAALERVRSKAMAMHKTEDLNEAVAVVFEELDKLNLGVLRVGISVLNKEKRCGNVWLTSIDEDKAVQVSGDESFDIHPLLQGAFEAWLRQEDFYYVLEGDDLTHYYQAVEAAKFKLPESQMFSSGKEFRRQYCFVAVYNSGGLFAFRETDFPEEAKMVIRRFAAVFDLTYKRFLDLQKAEAQSREAHIQLALERVRARTMAMQHSDELAEASVVLFQQFAALGETPDRISIGIINEDNKITDVWATNQAGTQINIHFVARNDEATTIQKIYRDWKAGKKSTKVDLQGEALKAWITYLRNELGMSIDDSYFQGRRIHQVSFFSQGWLNITTLEPLPPETLDLLDRFAAVFTLTYTRFVDLKKAEAQAREAQIEAALERTRSQSMLMQHSHELEHASQVFHEQLQLLGINSAFSYLWLLKEQEAEQTFWASWSEKKDDVITYKSSKISYPLDKTNPYIAECLVQWKSDETHPHLTVVPPEGVKDYFTTWEELFRDVKSLRPESFPDGLCYADAYMKYGSFGVVMSRDLSEEEYNILRRFSIEFERTYTRFLDLKQSEQLARQSEQDLIQLKIEKQKTEEALSELQVTQKQLIQSEKMASLGELTAGIAHEIQNPLNFVNNFSEVSSELINEMVDAVAKGDLEEAKALAEDVKQNLEKINFHGKRADGIVKGMLQHSRSSSGQKELTDINALADEYLRLAYHGLRAKDKSFNAKFEAKLDPSLEKINVMPQDMGRVILNLINNAFYAVTDKKRSGIVGYEPTVTVTTQRENGLVLIHVKDNGSGIPQRVLDKIFQPFFTTKPTGQGTGLGLSLSYDIVKAHGGELKVETEEGKGTVFTIQLPY